MALDLSQTYLHLGADRSAREVPLTDTFWQEIDSRDDLDEGRLVMQLDFTSDWPTWEVHPAGDEVVIVVRGHMRFYLEETGGVREVEVEAGQAVVVPRGVWHTADVVEPSTAVFLTPGEGTENRDRVLGRRSHQGA